MSKVPKRDDVLTVLQDGPVKIRQLLNGRSAAFRLVYRRLLDEGAIVEHGMGTTFDPKYVGLKGTKFPQKGYYVRAADIDLLVRSGVSRTDAEAALQQAVQTGGEASVIALCEQAYDRILSTGKSPLKHRPPPMYVKRIPTFGSVDVKVELLNENDF